MRICVSVVIPTFKREELLKRCLGALSVQSLDKSAYEIIVVDDAPTKETKELVLEYAARPGCPQIRYLTVPGKKGPAAARNRGWRAAEAPLIAFTDDDCIPNPDWLETGIKAFEPGVDGVSGRVVVPLRENPTDYERNASFLEHSEFVTANCFYRKEALLDVGGFDERFTTAWREDADLFFTLLQRNKNLISFPQAAVLHPIRAGHWGISIREQSKSRFNALLYKKHPQLYRKKIQSPVLLHYYLIIASAMLFFISFVLGIPMLGETALLVWAAGTVSLCLKRLRGTSCSLNHVLEMAVTSLVIPFLSIYWRLVGAVKFRVMFI